MACFSPLEAWRDLRNGSIRLTYHPKYCASPTPSFFVPCGQCTGCRLERSRQWAMRCQHEASLHPNNSFLTLTFSPENLPDRGSLVYEPFQDFMKRYRKRFSGTGIRFYMCGEYGENFGRPHYHACIFGHDFDDKKIWQRRSGKEPLYRSSILEKLWPHGHSTIGRLTFQSAAYVARYVMKKVTGEASSDHYSFIDPVTGESHQRMAEFNRMSTRPGIAAGWFDKFYRDVYPNDACIVNGRESRPPRYYDKLLSQLVDPFCDGLDGEAHLDLLKRKRVAAAAEHACDNTPERLKVREAVLNARLKQLVKTLT